MEIKAFIFDLDGVITDTAEYHFLAWKRLADEEGLPFTREDNEQLRGVSRRESLIRLLKGRTVPEETMQEYMQRKNDYYVAYLDEITPQDRLPGVTAFLDAAHAAGLKLGIGSASKNARPVLEKLGLLSMFEVVGDGYSVVNTKPAPDLFVWVAGGLRVPVEQSVVFEDAEAGVDAAKAAGCYAVGIGGSNINHADLVLPGLDAARVDNVITRLKAARTAAAR
ncbi:MAG: beta-phosphoglucomutase [Anaerolineae bacterium]